LNGNLGL